ncbi:ATP-binding protein [Rubellimicrobium roseum]|uniref:histidine kinase n=1 Tax=Rubellimicrobium roseum TaxID=687525 RepID=A0A5C4N6Z4_9RHOB|nr:HAMP domain-containing sensor histidine kinase [Rubellimicrobium roseum]TNC67243.1 HAMP domain-containing histidine kinase [Rubellimicrobium roseum]
MTRLLRNLPLSVRVPALVAGLMILVGVVASQQVLAVLGRVQEERLREIARLQVEGLAVALGPAVLREDVWEVYDTLDRASLAADGRRLVLTVVADGQGRVLAASDPRRAPVGRPIGPLAEGAQALEEVGLAAGLAEIRVLSSLEYQGRVVGQVLTELDVTDLAAERSRLVRMLLAGNAVLTALFALGGYWTVRRMMRPLRVLARHMDMTEGRPTAIPLDPRHDPEVARLFRTYNDMAGAVEARSEAERRFAERERYASLGRLSSSLAHEINNPLGGLLATADTLQAFADRPEVVQDGAALIERGLRHLRDVAKATLEQHRLDPEGAPLGADDLEDLRLLFSPEARRLEQALEWRVEARGDTLARLPAAPVRQIALNLLLNGSRAAGSGGTVGLDVEEGPGELRVVVRDSGPGLPDSALRRLLTSDPGGPGGGLGLRTVRDLAAALGARIDHARAAGRTEIRVRFPIPEVAAC